MCKHLHTELSPGCHKLILYILLRWLGRLAWSSRYKNFKKGLLHCEDGPFYHDHGRGDGGPRLGGLPAPTVLLPHQTHSQAFPHGPQGRDADKQRGNSCRVHLLQLFFFFFLKQVIVKSEANSFYARLQESIWLTIFIVKKSLHKAGSVVSECSSCFYVYILNLTRISVNNFHFMKQTSHIFVCFTIKK